MASSNLPCSVDSRRLTERIPKAMKKTATYNHCEIEAYLEFVCLPFYVWSSVLSTQAVKTEHYVWTEGRVSEKASESGGLVASTQDLPCVNGENRAQYQSKRLNHRVEQYLRFRQS